MEKKFTLSIEAWDFDKVGVKRAFVNDFGTWVADIKAEGEYFVGSVSLFSAFPQTKEALKEMKIKFKFTDPYAMPDDINYNFEASATQWDNTPRYDFDAHSTGLEYAYFIFDIKIEVDASSLQIADVSLSDFSLNNFGKKLLEEGKLMDVIIKTPNNISEIMANKVFLSRSPVFDAMLNRHDTKEAQEGVIIIKDVKHEILKEMIRYLHCDEVQKMNEMAIELLLAADKYNLGGLVKMCSTHLWSNITNENATQILITADKLDVADLKGRAIDYIIENRAEIFRTAEWKTLMGENADLALNVVSRL